ncbi:RHS repeat domain-containing protein, partial [uncultured Microbulbifer sp.]|uniref:RHS repeat domain-containing protein n=1 Tax=uncultured Microbulbifer sp. TaxID=348147 RepID=UPI002634AF7F
MRTGSKLPDGQYVITWYVDGVKQPNTIYYEIGDQYEYKPTVITWPASTQPDGAAAIFKYRINGSNDEWTNVSPTVEGNNHIATLEVLGENNQKITYEYLIEYIDGNQVVKSASGTFVVDKDGKTTDSSSASANFKFASTKYVEVGTASSVSGYFSEGVAASISRADIVVRDKISGQVVYRGSDYPADYLAWLKAENPNGYTYNGNLNLSTDFVRHSFNTSQNTSTTDWEIYDNDPAGATIKSVYDSTLKRNVIEIAGDAANNGFRTLHNGQVNAWNIADGTKARAELKLTGDVQLYYRLTTSKGAAYVNYRSDIQEPHVYVSSSNQTYYIFPLDNKYLDGNWQTFERDILADVAFLDQTVEVQEIEAFYIRGNGRIGTIEVDTHTPTGKGELGNGRYEVEVAIFDIEGDKVGTDTFDYEIGTQTEYHPTSFQWPVSSRPVSSDKTIFEYEASPNVWKSVPVLEDGANLKVILGDVDDGTIAEGNYNFRIRYEQNGVTVKETQGNPSLTVGKGSTKASNFDFEYKVVSLQSGSGHAISGYPVSIGSDPALTKIVAQVKDSKGQLVSSAETYPQLFGSYNGEVNLAIGSELAAGQAYNVTLTLHYDDGSSSVRVPFRVEVGEQPVQDRVIQWSESAYTPVAAEITRLEYRRASGDSNAWHTTAAIQNGSDFTANLGYELSGNYEYRIATYRDADGNGLSDNDRLLRTLSGTFAANDSGTKSASWAVPGYERSSAEGYAIEGYLSAAEAADIAYLETVVIDNATGSPISAQPTQTWIDPATLRDGSFAGRLNLLVGETLADGDYRVQVTRHYIDGSSRVDASFQQQVGRQQQSVTNPQLSLGLDEPYAASGVSLSIRPLGSSSWEALALDAATGVVELGKASHPNGVYEYQLSYTLDVDGVPVSKNGMGRFTLAAGESYTQTLSAAATGVDLADARIARSFYDDAGRVSTTLDAEGYLTEYRYNRAGQLVSSTRYANRVADYEQSSHWLNSGTLQTLRPAADSVADRSNYWLYDGQGREVAEINAEGYVTEHKYDVAGNRVKSTQYATALADLGGALAAVDDNPARLSLGGVDFVRHRFNDGVKLDVSHWEIYDSDPAGATVNKVYDDQLGRSVIELNGSGTNNGFRLREGNNGQFTSWGITKSSRASVELKLSGTTRIYYKLQTSKGEAYVSYGVDVKAPNVAVLTSKITYYNFPLETQYLDGNWHTLDRDIHADVASLDSEVEVQSIDWLSVRGSGRIGAVELLTPPPEAAGDHTVPGQLRLQTSSDDRTTEWRYDGRNQVTHATDASGNTSTFTYTAGGQLASSRSGIIASGSILDNYLDNYQGDPTFSANDSEARDYQFEYDVQGRVIAERDHQGRVVLSHSYDDSGRRISSTDANGYTTHFAYSADGLLKYSLAPVFNPGNNALEWQLSSFSHNAFGEVTGTRQYASRLSNTALNNLGLAGDAATLDSLAASLVAGEDTVTSTVYTQRGQVDNSTDGEGFVSTSQYNAFGERTRLSRAIDVANSRQAITDFSYSRRGELETSSAALSSGPFTSVGTTTTYNAFGEAVSSTDARGYSTDYAYDRLGRLVTQTDALAQQTHLSYDAFGRVLTRTDALDRSTRYEYDDANRSQTVTTPEGVQTRTVSNVHGETFEVSIKVGDSWLRQARYDYDTQGNLTDTTDALGNSARSEYNAAGQLTASVDASGVRTELTYDPQGRELTRTQDVGGLNLTTTQRYGHRYEETVDASGSATRTEYDKNGRVSRVIVDASSDGSGLNLLTQYHYDGQGNVLQVQEGSLSGGIDGSARIKRTTAYSYDELGRVLSETLDPNGLAITTRYEYDQAGNRTAMTNALGHSTYFIYDELGRERFVLTPLFVGSGSVTQYTAQEKQYDASGQLVANIRHMSAYGLPATLDIPSVAAIYNSATQWDRSTRYVYNDDGQQTHSIDALGQVTETLYNSAGRISAVIRYADRIDPSTETVADLVRDTSKDRETRYQYDATGRQTHTLRVFAQNGAQYAYVTESLYNGRGDQVGEIAYARALNLASETTADLNAAAADNRHSTLIYDAAGRRTHTVDSLGYVTETRYDDSNDSETVIRYANGITVPAASSWTDLSATDLGISTSSQHDQVIVTQYDAAGRKASLTEKVWADGALRDYVESYQYDALGNRTQISDPLGYKTYFSYDATGRLTHKQVPRNTTQGYLSTWRYDAQGQVLSETHYSQAVAQNADPSAINTNTLANAQDRSSRYTYNAGGKLQSETDSAGVITEHSYNAFGETWRTIEAKGLAEQRMIYRTFDQLGRLVEETSGLSDGDSSTISNRHNLTEAELGADEQVATTYLSYNSFGELETLVSPRGPSYISQQQHDQLGRKVGEIDARGGSTQTVLDAFGNIVATTDPNGSTGVFLYDANNQLTHQVTPDGAITTYRYDAFGQATDVRTYARKLVTSTDIAGLDRAGLDASLSGLLDAVRDRHSVSVYDNRGQLLSNSQYGYDLINGHATANTTRYEYDAAGNRTAVIDARGARTDYHYDAQGRVIQETGPEYYAALTAHSTQSTQVRAITKYSYNAFDKTFAGEGYYW